MQRIVKWTESYQHQTWQESRSHKSGYTNDLDDGTTRWFDIDAEALARSEPFLRDAFSRHGVLGKVTQHTHAVVGGNRIWTFVVEFDR